MTKDKKKLLLGKVVEADGGFCEQLLDGRNSVELISAENLGALRVAIESHGIEFVAIDRQCWDKQADVQLERREQEMWSYFELVPLPLAVVSKDMVIKKCNSAFQNLLGFEGDDFEPEPGLVGEKIDGFLDAEDRDKFRTEIEAVFSAKTGYFQGEHRYRTRDGLVVWVNHIGVPIMQSKRLRGNVLLVLVDVTRQKAAEQRNEHDMRINAIGEVAGGVAHDFNNVLAVVSASSYMLQESLQELGLRELVPYTEKMIQAIERGAALTRQLLSFRGTNRIETKVVDLNAHLRGIDEMLQDALNENIALDIELAPGPLLVEPGTGELDQIVMNITLNARDAMPDGGTLRIVASEVKISSQEDSPRKNLPPGNWAQLEFTDNGLGMDAETKQRLFEPFYTTKGLGKGTGMGLVAVYRSVNRMNGRIYVDSTLGVGTTFTIYLPIVKRSGVQRSSESEEMVSEGNGRDAGGACILLLEDEEDLRRPYRVFLERAGYRVLEAGSVQQAQTIFDARGDEIDLLVSDIVLPDGSGVKFAERVEDVKPELDVVFISGYAPDLIYRSPKEHKSGWAFLPKPVSREKLVSTVDAHLGDGGV